MKAMQIITEELKNNGLHVTEEAIKAMTVVLFDKVIPRLAAEADESMVKSIAAGLAIVSAPAKEALLKLEDKIDGVCDDCAPKA